MAEKFPERRWAVPDKISSPDSRLYCYSHKTWESVDAYWKVKVGNYYLPQTQTCELSDCQTWADEYRKGQINLFKASNGRIIL